MVPFAKREVVTYENILGGWGRRENVGGVGSEAV